jgi:hypothetical protein
MLALQCFQDQHGKRPDFQEWLRQSRPLSQIPSLQRLLALDQLAKERDAEVSPPAAPPSNKDEMKEIPAPSSSPLMDRPLESAALHVGNRLGLTSGAVTLEPEELKQHAAFLGTSGSGKTTAALNLVEQLLMRGIPAILVDRKGDLCRYADPPAWQEPLHDPLATERRRQLRERIAVALYTPGQPDGRPLTLPLVPEGIDRLSSVEREQLAGYAAAALGGMLGYTNRGHNARLAILRKAIEVLSAFPGSSVTIARLQQLIESHDDALLTAIGGFDDRQYKQLASDLLALRINKRRLLEGQGELLDCAMGSAGSPASWSKARRYAWQLATSMPFWKRPVAAP